MWERGDPQAALLAAGGHRHLNEAAATEPRAASSLLSNPHRESRWQAQCHLVPGTSQEQAL